VQTFYRRVVRDGNGSVIPSESSTKVSARSTRAGSTTSASSRQSVEEEEDINLGRALGREYLKEMLSAHSLWHNGGFWDKALWYWCIEQVGG
jgi:hypothetical protein